MEKWRNEKNINEEMKKYKEMEIWINEKNINEEMKKI